MNRLEALEEIEGITVVHASRDGAGRVVPGHAPVVGICGSIHGNERCGLNVLQALQNPEHPLRQRLYQGTLVLIHGNPRATELERRHTADGPDLNRLFDYHFAESLPQDAWRYEHHRAMALRPVLESLDALLDLHSATSPSHPFVITSPGLAVFAEQLGCPFVTWGWDGPGLLADRVLTSPLIRRGRVGVSVECGQHLSAESTVVAFDVAERFLFQMGLLRGERPAPRPCTRLEVVHRVGRPTVNFRFHREWSGFDVLSPGDLIGEGDGVRLNSKSHYHILLPNPHVAVGEDMLYLAELR